MNDIFKLLDRGGLTKGLSTEDFLELGKLQLQGARVANALDDALKSAPGSIPAREGAAVSGGAESLIAIAFLHSLGTVPDPEPEPRPAPTATSCDAYGDQLGKVGLVGSHDAFQKALGASSGRLFQQAGNGATFFKGGRPPWLADPNDNTAPSASEHARTQRQPAAGARPATAASVLGTGVVRPMGSDPGASFRAVVRELFAPRPTPLPTGRAGVDLEVP
jgi:hypothetical protein